MAGKTFWNATALLALAATAGFGQDAMLEELYGRGVHAFFSGNQTEAFNSLNAAIKSGSRDPRAFYYRGLILSRFGRPTEASDDFKKGAELEILGGEPYPVGRALERIQGTERVNLEAHRRAARLAIHNQQSAAERARYEEIKRAENGVLRSGGAPNLPPPVPAGRPDASDPFTPSAPAPLPPPAAPAARMPAPAAAPPAAADPFAPAAEAPLPAEAPARPAPAAPAPAATPPAPKPAPPADDPFADAPVKPAAAPATPAPPTPAPPANDPFAETPATPAPTTPAAPTPAPPAADPFAEPATPAPAAPPAPKPAPPKADDPFAEPATPAPPAPATP